MSARSHPIAPWCAPVSNWNYMKLRGKYCDLSWVCLKLLLWLFMLSAAVLVILTGEKTLKCYERRRRRRIMMMNNKQSVVEAWLSRSLSRWDLSRVGSEGEKPVTQSQPSVGLNSSLLYIETFQTKFPQVNIENFVKNVGGIGVSINE